MFGNSHYCKSKQNANIQFHRTLSNSIERFPIPTPQLSFPVDKFCSTQSVRKWKQKVEREINFRLEVNKIPFRHVFSEMERGGFCTWTFSLPGSGKWKVTSGKVVLWNWARYSEINDVLSACDLFHEFVFIHMYFPLKGFQFCIFVINFYWFLNSLVNKELVYENGLLRIANRMYEYLNHMYLNHRDYYRDY